MSALLAHRILLMIARCTRYVVGSPTGQVLRLDGLAFTNSDNPVNPTGGILHLCNEVVE